MERGFEQLIVIAAVILAGVFDVLVRWVKSRQRRDAPVDATRYDEKPLLVEEEADFELPADVDLPSDIELSGEELVERTQSRGERAERAQSREEQAERALSREEQVERAQFGEELVERRVPMAPPPPPVPARAPVVSRRPAPPPPIRPRRVSRRLLTSPLDARRGIIMMTILGPCRGLERPDSEATQY